MPHEGSWSLPCAICRETVNLEESNTDEYGRAVHELCYVSTVVSKKPRRPMVRIEVVSRMGINALSGEAS